MAKRIYYINHETFKIVKEYSSLSELGREIQETVFKGDKHFYTIINSVKSAMKNKTLYCGKRFVYECDYDNLVESVQKDLKIKIEPNSRSIKSSVRIKDIYIEYKRIKKLLNTYLISFKEFDKIITAYYDYLFNKLLKDGELYDLNDDIGKFKVCVLDSNERSISKRNLINYLTYLKKDRKKYNIVIKWSKRRNFKYEKFYLFKFNKKLSRKLLDSDDGNISKYEII